jgi:hypothetical protein
VFIDPALWALLGRALGGDPIAQGRCALLDAWADASRQETLARVAQVVRVLFRASMSTRDTARRGYRTLYGSVRRWRSETGSLPEPEVNPATSTEAAPSPVEAALSAVWSLAKDVPGFDVLVP